MGLVKEVDRAFRGQLVSLGRQLLSTLYPNDFEYYLLALELVDSSGTTIDYFSFPITPAEITYTKNALNNVKKTAGGVNVTNTTTFVPYDIQIAGNFGRAFRFVLGSEQISFKGFSFSSRNGVFSREGLRNTAAATRTAVFNSTVKNGYGAFRMLEGIFEKSSGLDPYGNPYRLFMYNPIFNQNLVVKPVAFTGSQNVGSQNMLHTYNLTLRAVQNLENTDFFGRYTVAENLVVNTVNKSASNLVRLAKKLLI